MDDQHTLSPLDPKKPWWRAALAELAGSALLVGLLAAAGAGESAGERLTHGLVTGALVQAFYAASGALLSPALAVAAAAGGVLSCRRALQLGGAGLAGAVLAGGLCPAVVSAAAGNARGVLAAGAIEAARSGALTLVFLRGWDPLGAALAIMALDLAGDPVCGAGLNPLRVVPALMSTRAASLPDHYVWVHGVAPMLGAASCALLCRVLRRPPRRARPPRSPEAVP